MNLFPITQKYTHTHTHTQSVTIRFAKLYAIPNNETSENDLSSYSHCHG